MRSCPHDRVWMGVDGTIIPNFEGQMGCSACDARDTDGPSTWRMPPRMFILIKGDGSDVLGDV